MTSTHLQDGCWMYGPKYVPTVGQACCLEVQGNPGANEVVDEAHGKGDFGAQEGPPIPCEQCSGRQACFFNSDTCRPGHL